MSLTTHQLLILALPLELLVEEYADGFDLNTIDFNTTDEPGLYTIKRRDNGGPTRTQVQQVPDNLEP